ncbi:MAG: acyl-CoA synthetase [Janthinobacterium lividum]
MLKDCLIAGERVRSRQEVLANSRRAARGFDALGIREGDVVALLLRNDFAFLEASEGANLLGAYGVPINWHSKGDELTYIISDAAPKVLVAHADLLAAVRDQLPPTLPVIVVASPPESIVDFKLSPESAAVPGGATEWNAWLSAHEPWDGAPKPPRQTMIYTSGTTGRPKGVRRDPASPAQIAARTKHFREIYGLSGDMRGMVTGPMYHTSPNGFARFAMHTSDILVMQSRFDAERTLADIERYQITHAVMVPTMFVRILKLPVEVRNKYDVSSLKWITHTAAPCPPDVKRALIDWWGPIIHEVYGGTEVGTPFACTSEEWLEHPGTVGRPTEGTVVALYDDDGRVVEPGGIGEIYVSCPAYPDFTYHNQPEKRASVERDGLISVGDVGYINDGFLYLCDRKSDMVITGGVNLYPAEIETVLLQSPAVRDCAIFGVPDDDLGEVLHAAVELQPGQTLSEEGVRQFIRERLGSMKVPRNVEFHLALPREDSGKIFKRRLREPHWQGKGRRI